MMRHTDPTADTSSPKAATEDTNQNSKPQSSTLSEALAPSDATGLIPKPTRRSAPEGPTLEELLAQSEEERHNEVWDLYKRKDFDDQPNFQRAVMLYLSKSDSVVQINRVLELFRKTPPSEWDSQTLTAGVQALSRSGDLGAATDALVSGLERDLSGGIEHILNGALSVNYWHTAAVAWLKFYHHSETQAATALKSSQLEVLRSLPDIDYAFESLGQYIKGDVPQILEDAAEQRQGLLALHRCLASAVLDEPCSAKDAIPLLTLFQNSDMYHDYITMMLQRLHEGTEASSELVSLGEIYKSYRDLPDAKPSAQMLRGMFNVYFPSDPEGLEMVYTDWQRTLGGLDQWAYEKFLKFYATAGDVTAVKDLWTRYAAAFPESVKSPRAFRSTMNVYAQTGDVEQAELEMQRMTDQFDVAPDLDIWNMLLKCYMRANQYQKTLSCFEEICNLFEADSFTFAHAMAMSAKQGDIDTTLKLFNKAQAARITVTREMTMALVMVYLRNERLHDAESICTEFAARGATSTLIWNQLIHYNGLKGKLSKCYELLRTMKDFDIDWNDQTHEFLLQAMVKVDQIQSAYQLLQRAYRDKLFPVGTEQFAIVLAGAVRVGDPGLVETLTSQMRREGLPTTFNSQVVLVDAAFRQAPTSIRTRNLTKGLVEQLRALVPSSANRKDNMAAGDVSDLRMKTRNIGRAVHLLIQMREFHQAEELVTLYNELLPPTHGFHTPMRVTSALLHAYLEEGHYTQVLSLWKSTWERTLSRTKRQDASTIYAAYRYDLSRPVALAATALRETNSPDDLVALVRSVTTIGFKLTRNTWNLIIRYLADMGHWQPAMHWCEAMLMPRWRGWDPPKRQLQERREMKDMRILQASHSTVLSLQRQWLRLRKLSAWSADVSAKLNHIEKEYPMLHYAFITTDYEDLPDNFAGSSMGQGNKNKGKVGEGKSMSLTKGAKQILKPMQLEDLKTMQKSLDKALEEERRKVDEKKGRARKVPIPKRRAKFKKPSIF